MSGTHTKSVIRIGLDDTDHIDYACTTEHFHRLLSQMVESIDGFQITERRLVRLWPFAPERTRGNAALSAICTVDSNTLDSVDRICVEFIEELNQEIQTQYPEFGEKPSPCLLLALEDYPEQMYCDAVRSEVSLNTRLANIPNSTKIYSIDEKPNGIIGASSAIAWKPNNQSTWELIAWRFKDNIRSTRKVSIDAVNSMSEKYPSTFANRDPTTGRGMIMPRTNCPVLYGIRGESLPEVKSAHLYLQDRDDVENSVSWAIHRTNQISDDHLLGFESGIVLTNPLEVQGGHSSVRIWTGDKSAILVAFSESGEVNSTLRRLKVGDVVDWLGLTSLSSEIHLERLRVQIPAPRIGNRPQCCGKTMRSVGLGQGLRCKACGKLTDKVWDTVSTSFSTEHQGWVEPTPSNRRHLAKPLDKGLPIRQNNQD